MKISGDVSTLFIFRKSSGCSRYYFIVVGRFNTILLVSRWSIIPTNASVAFYLFQISTKIQIKCRHNCKLNCDGRHFFSTALESVPIVVESDCEKLHFLGLWIWKDLSIKIYTYFQALPVKIARVTFFSCQTLLYRRLLLECHPNDQPSHPPFPLFLKDWRRKEF